MLLRLQMCWAGHAYRIIACMESSLLGKETEGGPKKCHTDCLRKYFSAWHIDHRLWSTHASDLDTWKQVIYEGINSFENGQSARMGFSTLKSSKMEFNGKRSFMFFTSQRLRDPEWLLVSFSETWRSWIVQLPVCWRNPPYIFTTKGVSEEGRVKGPSLVDRFLVETLNLGQPWCGGFLLCSKQPVRCAILQIKIALSWSSKQIGFDREYLTITARFEHRRAKTHHRE